MCVNPPRVRCSGRLARTAPGDRARLFGNLPRLNEFLKLVQLHLLRLDDANLAPKMNDERGPGGLDA
jgi:hypothetical protein